VIDALFVALALKNKIEPPDVCNNLEKNC